MADSTSTSWKDAGVFNAGLWRIGNDCATSRVFWPSYKWRLFCYGAHTLNLLPFGEVKISSAPFSWVFAAPSTESLQMGRSVIV